MLIVNRQLYLFLYMRISHILFKYSKRTIQVLLHIYNSTHTLKAVKNIIIDKFQRKNEQNFNYKIVFF